MRNLSMLLFAALATFGLWVFVSAYILAPAWVVGASYRVYFGVATWPDAVTTLIFAGWAFWLGRLTRTLLFSGASASRFRWATVALLVLFFLHARGVFITSNWPGVLFSSLVLAAIVFTAAFFGTRRHDRTELAK